MKARPLVRLSHAERHFLEAKASSGSVTRSAARQAQGLLWLSDGLTKAEVARRLDVYPEAVGRWVDRFGIGGVEAVGVVASGRGRKRKVIDPSVEPSGPLSPADHERLVAEFMATARKRSPGKYARLAERSPVLTDHQLNHRLRQEISVGDEFDIQASSNNWKDLGGGRVGTNQGWIGKADRRAKEGADKAK